MNRLLSVFGLVMLVIGAYSAFTENHPVMGILLALGAVAVAIPTFLDWRK